ncbi:MAG: MAPEG family protein [Gammaproteobacteria bacterium]|nr:MAPEG family protein [Gammaproteobacteria bacterium]
MTSELTMLTWVTLLTAVMWLPYVLNTIMVRGIIEAVGYPENPAEPAAWAVRMKASHYNAIENLVVFAAAVLIANAAGISNDTTVMACNIYFWARVVHYLAYTFAIPWVRTLGFAAGWICTILVILQLL